MHSCEPFLRTFLLAAISLAFFFALFHSAIYYELDVQSLTDLARAVLGTVFEIQDTLDKQRDDAQAEVQRLVDRMNDYLMQTEDAVKRLETHMALAALPFSPSNARESDDYLTRLERARRDVRRHHNAVEGLRERMLRAEELSRLGKAEVLRRWWWFPALYIPHINKAILDFTQWITDLPSL
ncbi:Hypothetical predicted protein [Lecanosticta acicola]|uniref:Uncharacterized protein n=1 Tax=Lecanosticta acicola TaxID=111012 RepID=A0AAI8YVB4_9PEZI|nr:Hypothetical predicted protein [Lecanosticta acicola]